MTFNTITKEKDVRIQLGNPNVLRYKITDTTYEFAIKYLGVRRAYFTYTEDDSGTKSGKIKEILIATVAGKTAEYTSAADFYIDDNYVSVIGNKADGIIGFSNVIAETYDAKTGRMLGYEIKESLKSIVYNTLWFDLEHITGLNNIKYHEKNPEVTNDTTYFNINNSAEPFKNKKVGGVSLKTASRRFDIEFRDRFYYSYDSVNKEYIETKASVPMIFIQEEVLGDFVNNMKSTNNVKVSINIDETSLAKIQAVYDEKVSVFEETKDDITSDTIIGFIG